MCLKLIIPGFMNPTIMIHNVNPKTIMDDPDDTSSSSSIQHHVEPEVSNMSHSIYIGYHRSSR